MICMIKCGFYSFHLYQTTEAITSFSGGQCIHGIYDANQGLLVLKFTKELCTRPYIVTKRMCVWNTMFPLDHFMLHFTTFIMVQHCEMTTKASNGNCKCAWKINLLAIPQLSLSKSKFQTCKRNNASRSHLSGTQKVWTV